MKKNISINISGIIFHIEEDGYDRLKSYLDSITRYFSTFNDSKEIISDIEGRIAEIFLSKLSDEKQVITEEDVQSLISTMGSVEDFQALEDSDELKGKKSDDKDTGTAGDIPADRELKRDISRKLVGGVCAGIAAYFAVDPLWIRLLTIVLIIGSSGIILIVYAVMWAILPASDKVAEGQKVKKMFRNPDGKVLAGVASGVAAYFGVDVSVVRVLFVIFAFFGGTGILAYLILWIILPEANSITEKVQMQGEPVTLSNIESNIKKNLNVKENEEENLLVKILLFPFRLISTVIGGIGKALGPFLRFVVDFLRVMVGAMMTLIGIMLAFVIVVTLGILSGLLTGGMMYNWTFDNATGIASPILMFFDSIPSITYAAAFAVAIIPSVVIILLGISVIMSRIVFSQTVGWSLFGIFMLGVIFLSVNVPGIAYSFHEEARIEETRNFDSGYNTIYLKVDESRGLDDYEVTDIYLRGHESENITAVLEFSSMGGSREDAANNARMVEYRIEQKDSLLTFDYNLSFKEGTAFKFQELDVTLYIPFEKPFVMDKTLRDLLSYRSIERYGYSKSQVISDNKWMFTEIGLECLTCERVAEGWSDDNNETLSRLVDLRDFNTVTVNSPITVEIRKSDTYRVEIKGDEKFVEDVEIVQDQDEIEITFGENTKNERNFTRGRNDIKVLILVPELIKLEMNQASKTYVRNISGKALEIEMNGAASAEVNADIENLSIRLNGASKLSMAGTGQSISVDVNGSSDLDAYGFRSKNAEIVAKGASVARIFATDTASIDRDLVSTVRIRGGATEN